MGWNSSQIIAHENQLNRCSRWRRNTQCDVKMVDGSKSPLMKLSLADELLVKAGELFPVDGVIIEGATSADESALTGEATSGRKTNRRCGERRHT